MYGMHLALLTRATLPSRNLFGSIFKSVRGVPGKGLFSEANRLRLCRMASSSFPPEVSTPISGRRDAYDGLIINADSLPATSAEFVSQLDSSLEAWSAAGLRGIWLKLPLDKAHFVGHSVDAGFAFHHAEPGYVMMTHWLPESPSTLPPNASHQVGVGAFVFDRSTKSVLVVQERAGPLRGKGVWKMPTGLVQAGEDITEAAVREVEEETGIKAQFRVVLAMRQAHGMAFGKSDIFFVVGLEPEGEAAAQQIALQEEEVEAAMWMPLGEYAAVPFTQSRPLLRKILERCTAWADGRYAGLGGVKLESGSTERRDLLLFGESPEEEAGDDAPQNEDAWIGLN